MGEWETLHLVELLHELALRGRAGGRHAEAESHYRRALALLESSVAPGHASRATIRRGYATLLAELGRDAEAAQLEAGDPLRGES